MTAPEERHDRLEHATRARLSRLAGVRGDAARVERRLRAVLAQARPRQPERARLARLWWRVGGIAAVLAAGAILALALLHAGSQPVVAAPMELVRVHHDMLRGDVDAVAVTSFREAGDVLRGKWPQTPRVPQAGDGRITSCCLHALRNRKVACIRLEHLGRPVTVVVGHARDLVCSADHRPMARGGRTYLVHEEEGVNMAMMQVNGRWACVMGDLPLADLVDLADGLAFAPAD